MEFSRRGPASTAAGSDVGHRFPDPPAQGERDPVPANLFPDPPSQGEREATLVMREALLSQLHMASLRQEIVEAELAKIERAMALHAAAGGHQTQTVPMPMPMPWRGVATADAERSQPWPFIAEQPMAPQNAGFDERKQPDSNKDALLAELHMARLRQEAIEAEVAQIEHAMALRTTVTGGHQTQTKQTSVPWHGVATVDAGMSKARPLSAEHPVAQ